MLAHKVTGYGNVDAQNVFGVSFSQDLSSLVKYECWDNDQSFPAVDDVETVTNDVLAGTAGNSNLSMISLVDTTNASPGDNWKPSSATAGEANPNRMKGQVSYVEQDGDIITAGGRITFNMVAELPSDALTSMSMGFDLAVRFTYTGTAPTTTWEVNTGTEETPTWTEITPDTEGIIHCRAGSGAVGSGGDGHYYANIPNSGTEDTAEAWTDTSVTPS